MSKPISEAELKRIADAAQYARSHGRIKHLSANHGMLSVYAENPATKKPDWRLVYDGRSSHGGNALAYLLCHASPDKMDELIAGYRWAKEHGYGVPEECAG